MAKTEKEAVDWFIGKAKTASGYRKNLMSKPDRDRSSTVIGKMYFFYYDPKHKKTLPMYDRFPLVFPIEPYADGFLGLNLHYLSGSQRGGLLNALMKYKTARNMTETSKLRLSYDLLQGTKAMGLAQPCIKRYLFGHVRSPFIEIIPAEWENAIALPVEMFVYKK
jgi:hypothetical protein